MHILSYLKSAEQLIKVDEQSVVRFEDRLEKDMVRVEYRLICSGTFFPAHLQGDWTRSDGARILLMLPVVLLVASRPYDDYPQELVLRFVVPMVHETNGNISHSYYPDAEIASDLAALMTLTCRRLVTVSVKVREEHGTTGVPPILADFPVPVVVQTKRAFWSPRPMEFMYGLEGVKVRSYHPPPVPFSSPQFIQTLLTLPKLATATAILRAARLYASAMERIESQPDICYQLLISAAETMAGAALDGWEPDKEGKIASRSGLVSYATKTEKLSKEIAERIALESSKDNPWSSRKFKKFIIDHLDKAAIQTEDDLFIVPQELCPKDDEIEDAIGEVYRTRSGFTHSGQSYPASAAIGPSVRFPARAFDCLVNQQRPFPPIGWFERVVNHAICAYIRSQVAQASSAAQEPTKELV